MNWIVLVELGLVVLLMGLGAAIYWVPVAGSALTPRWWHAVVLAALFFLLIGLDTWRRRHRRHAALHQALRDPPRRG